MPLNSPHHWLPPEVELEEDDPVFLALFLETRACIRKMKPFENQKMILDQLKRDHVNTCLALENYEDTGKTVIGPVVTYSLRIKQKIDSVLGKRKKIISVDEFLDPHEGNDVLNGIYSPLRRKLASAMTWSFIHIQTRELMRQFKEMSPDLKPKRKELREALLNEHGDQLQAFYTGMREAKLKVTE